MALHSSCVSSVPSSPEPEAPRGPGKRRHRVLLVDPDVGARSELAAGLASAGFEVLEAASAEEAQAALGEGHEPPHLVLAETDLGGSDGFAFCAQLRADAATADVPVYLLARRQEEFHRDLAGSVGADDYLARPVEVRDLVTLARLMAGQRASERFHPSHTSRLPLVDTVRALLAGVRSGRVMLREGNGWLAFRQGAVVDAAFAGQQGPVALRRLLGFGTGTYAVSFGPESHRGAFVLDRERFHAQVLPAVERFEFLRAAGVPLAARLTVDFTELAPRLPTLPGDVGELLRLFDGRRTVRAVLLESYFSEVVAYESITRLYMLGMLVPACLVEERARGGGFRSFEPVLSGAQAAHSASP